MSSAEAMLEAVRAVALSIRDYSHSLVLELPEERAQVLHDKRREAHAALDRALDRMDSFADSFTEDGDADV